MLAEGIYHRFCCGRFFTPGFKAGDKRILLIDGKPVPYALARMPAEGETRANLASGGTGVGQVLSERDRYIAETVASNMRGKGLYLVGLDVIGDYLTEVNVTSPTCMRELEREFKLDISGQFIETLIEKAST